MSIVKIIGIVLLVVGVIVLVFGAYNLITYNNSTGGKIANEFAGVFGKRTEAVRNSIIMIAAGAAGACVGFVLYRRG